MFGWKRAAIPTAVDWPSLLTLLEDDDRRAAVKQDAPADRRESYLSSLRRIDAAAADHLLVAGRQLHSATSLVDRPTVAIAGMLNSGKTSLVSTFLSPEGSERTLRGTENEAGTHRFVLWLPRAWKSDLELWQLLLSRIGDALGAAPEMLADDPAQAHRQYNNRGGDTTTLQVPLVATDPGLNVAGIGLLDCPDIVSDASLGLGSPEDRRRLLGQAATLCSAFLVVSSAESSRDSNLSDLLQVASDLMPGVPRLLAVNKVRPPQSPDQVYETFSRLADAHGIDTTYIAYDFDVPKSRPFIPTPPEDGSSVPSAVVSGTDDDLSMPLFYAVDPDPENNPPANISADRLLSALPGKLDRGALFASFQGSLQSRLITSVREDGLSRIEAAAEESLETCRQAQACLLDVTLDFFAHRDVAGKVMELRLHQNERIIRQLSEAFADTSPWYARWGVRMNTTLRRVFGGVRDFFRQLTPTAMAQRTADEVKDKFKRGEFGGLLSPEKLRASIRRNAGESRLPHWTADAPWDEATETAVLRFEQDDFTALDPRRLHTAAQAMWDKVPRHKKLASGLTPLLAMFATLGGVLMIPVDFGANLIAFASISELFAAAGLTTLSAIWAAEKSMQDVGHQAARQQVADFHAVLCDCFGVPRPNATETIGPLPALSVKGAEMPMLTPEITRRDAEGPKLTVYHVRDEFRNDLSRLLP